MLVEDLQVGLVRPPVLIGPGPAWLCPPPRRTFAPAFLTAAVVASTCSSVSAEHGPAMTMTSSPPIRTSPIVMTVFSGRKGDEVGVGRGDRRQQGHEPGGHHQRPKPAVRLAAPGEESAEDVGKDQPGVQRALQTWLRAAVIAGELHENRRGRCGDRYDSDRNDHDAGWCSRSLRLVRPCTPRRGQSSPRSWRPGFR